MPRRERVTVTLRDDLLRSLDRLVDSDRIRNRSHALEYVLSRALGSGPTQAVILASGKGVNMRPFTYETPKPLIPVQGKPILEHTIERLREAGFRDITITVSHLADKIIDYFKDGASLGVSITYVKEKKTLGTGWSLREARKHLKTSPFLLWYGDVLLDVDMNELVQVHQGTDAAIATLVLSPVFDPSAYGAVKLRGSKIVDFEEKPEISPSVSHLIFSGCAVLDQKIFDYFPSRKPKQGLSLENDVFPKLVSEGVLHGYPASGQWFDVSTPEIYEQVLKHWKAKV